MTVDNPPMSYDNLENQEEIDALDREQEAEQMGYAEEYMDKINREYDYETEFKALGDEMDAVGENPFVSDELYNKWYTEKMAQINTDRSKAISDANSSKMGQLGNTVGAVSGALGNIANLALTLSSDEKVTKNPFANYATDAINKIAEMKNFASGLRDLQMQDVTLAKNTARANNRNSARGVNDLRALDMGTFVGGMGEQRKINQNYQQTMMGIADKEANALLDRDRNVMAGQERTNLINQQNRDAYRSEM